MSLPRLCRTSSASAHSGEPSVSMPSIVPIQRTSSGAMLIDLNSSCSLSFPEECEALSSSSLEGEFEEEFLLA